MALPKSLTTVTTFSKTIAMILFILLLFAGFYLGYKYREGTYTTIPITQNNPTPIPSPYPTSANQIIDTSTWKTYTDTALGFSFKYPGKLTLKENNTNIVLDNYKEIDYNPKESPFRGNEVENISITIIISKDTVNSKNTLENYLDKKYPVNEVGAPSYQNQKNKLKIITLDGGKGLLSERGMLYENLSRMFWIKKESQIIIFTAYGSGETGTGPSKIAEITFDQIISTIKFIQ